MDPTKYVPVPPVRGVDVWHEIKDLVRYQENVAVNPQKKAQAIEIQKHPAPYRVGEPDEGDTRPLTLDGAADNLLDALDSARRLVEAAPETQEAKEIKDFDELQSLERPKARRTELERKAHRVLHHAREITRVLEDRARLRRIAPEVPGLRRYVSSLEGDEADGRTGAFAVPEGEAEIRPPSGLMDRARLVEANALRFWRAAARHSESGVREWWGPLLVSCKGIPRIASEIDLVAAGVERRKKRRAKPDAKAGTKRGERAPEKTRGDEVDKIDEVNEVNGGGPPPGPGGGEGPEESGEGM